MNKAFTIARKELANYFKTPSAYIVLVVAFCIFNVFFFMIINENREATLRDVFKVMQFMFIFIIPILTMRLLSEERSSGTLEFLMTSPVGPFSILMGKYMGVVIFFTMILSINFLYYGIIALYSAPDGLTFLSGFLGLWLEGLLFCAIGLMTSALTRHQTIAALMSYCLLFALYFSLSFIQYTSGNVEAVVRYFSTITHAENFHQGLIHVSDIVYYCSGAIFCLLLTKRSLKNKS